MNRVVIVVKGGVVVDVLVSDDIKDPQVLIDDCDAQQIGLFPVTETPGEEYDEYWEGQ